MKLIYLLDTNIISEMAKPQPDANVIERISRHDGHMGVPALVWHELLYGVARLPEGKRRASLRSFLYEIVSPNFPVVPYDEHAAFIHAAARQLQVERGKTAAFVDSQIAAIAVANNLILVTRNGFDSDGFTGLMREDWFSQPWA
ncbi:MAG: type II toxin-antitoxin system VapC family toxin [Spirochaetaceae bacterium]|nr:type II toxin-antitoxin system VapC family toxin [Spirochaetaceae bacterium]